MKVLRTIESFLPAITGPTRQAFEISKRLADHGISSPVLTSTLDIDPGLPAEDNFDGVPVTRLPYCIKLMRYAVTPGMTRHMPGFEIIHSHNYRNYQTDRAFFLPAAINFPLS